MGFDLFRVRGIGEKDRRIGECEARVAIGSRRFDAVTHQAGDPRISELIVGHYFLVDVPRHQKQRVVAAVTTQKECLSDAGHYRFLQTRNLNSFLMWVERTSGRAEADRCVELRHALDCLKRQARTRSRSG